VPHTNGDTKANMKDSPAPQARRDSILSMLSIAGSHQWDAFMLEFPNALLTSSSTLAYGDAPDEDDDDPLYAPVYLRCGYSGKHTLLKVKDNVPGLANSSLRFFRRINNLLNTSNYLQLFTDSGVFTDSLREKKLIIALYGSVMLFVSSSSVFTNSMLAYTADQIDTQADMIVTNLSSGAPARLLGMDIIRAKNKGPFMVSLQSYTASLLKAEAASVAGGVRETPLDEILDADIDDPMRDASKPYEHPERYASIVSKLLYIAQTARVDILFAASALARRTKAPTERDWAAAVKVMQYLNGSLSMGMQIGRLKAAGDDLFPYLRGSVTAVRYSDGSVRAGYTITLDNSTVSWGSFIDSHKTWNQCDATILAADAAFKKMSQIYKLVQETNTEENMHTPKRDMGMMLLTSDREFVHLFCGDGRKPFSIKDSIDAIGRRLRNEFQKVDLVLGITS
jgi:hypothetical protein